MSGAFVFDYKARQQPPPGSARGGGVVDRLFAEHAARSARLAEARRAKEEQEMASLRRPPSPCASRRPSSPAPAKPVHETLYAQHFKREEALQTKRQAAEQREREAIEAARRENLPTIHAGLRRHPSPAKSVVSSVAPSLHARAEIKCMQPKFDLLNASRLSRQRDAAPRPLRDLNGRVNFGGGGAGRAESVASRNSRGSVLPAPSEAAMRLFAEDAARKAKIERLREVSLAREKAEIEEAKLRLKVEIQKAKPKENKRLTALFDAALKTQPQQTKSQRYTQPSM